MNRGKFIVFEGINGSGKTTIINELFAKLSINNNKIKIIKFPNRQTKTGKIINKFLKNEYEFKNIYQQIKCFADNRLECKDEIQSLINNGYIILCDRYIYSNIAYILSDQTMHIINNQISNNLLTFRDIIQYDLTFINPDFVFLINGDHIILRNDQITERYHKNLIKNILIFNNYLNIFNNMNTDFTIINNNLDNLQKNINIIINIIRN